MDKYKKIYFKLKELIISSQEFEDFIYNDQELEKFLKRDDYLNLISLDYSKRISLYEAEKVFKLYIQEGEYLEWKLVNTLNKIIKKPQDVDRYIVACYDHYCDGYDFLDILGLKYGLFIVVPPDSYKVETWCQLSENEKKEYINSFYPEIAHEAKKVLNWFKEKEIVIKGEGKESGSIDYEDFRNKI